MLGRLIGMKRHSFKVLRSSRKFAMLWKQVEMSIELLKCPVIQCHRAVVLRLQPMG